ncbi:conserved exported protein of unknown function [Aminobacter niigataensis]|nr:conserved exported protein of unknown function [Aminobacter niigataensis]
MRRVLIGAAALVAAWTGAAAAQDSGLLAFELGDVIGSERGCKLRFDQSAIERFIEANAPNADMGFMSQMNGAADIMADKFSGFTASQKTAHCTQVRRVAKANGFID